MAVRPQGFATLNDLSRESIVGPPETPAAANARARLMQIGASVGTKSPDYAAALNQFALVLIMQGDPDAAEPLLRQALEIRQATLGEVHPDYATNLSSLGGLLWARGDLDEAERLLRKAADIRFESLGATHPKSIVSLKSLDQLLQAKREQARLSGNASRPASSAPVSEGVPIHSAPVSHASDLVDGIAAELAARLEPFQDEFARLGDRLARVGEELRSGRLPGDFDLRGDVSALRKRFETLRIGACKAFAAEGLAVHSLESISLSDLVAVLPTLREAEIARLEHASGRQRALDVLDQVQRLVSRTDPGFLPLSECQSASQTLRAAIESAARNGLPEEANSLKEGNHPLNALVSLISADDSTGDALWADWFDSVAAAFGNALAVAAARGRIVVENPA